MSRRFRSRASRASLAAAAALAAAPAPCRAEAPKLALEARSSCPSRALIERELAPLLEAHELAALGEPAPLTAQVDDFGGEYAVRVGAALRQISDPERHCLERARVAAVFIALNLPEAAPERAPANAAEPREAPADRPPAVPPSREGGAVFGLRAFAFTEAAPELEAAATGVGLGPTLDFGRFEILLSAGVAAPIKAQAAEGTHASYELLRAPLALLAAYTLVQGTFELGAEGGFALDWLRFRGESVPNAESGVRLNTGLRLDVPLRFRATRGFSAVLAPSATFFPRTYIVRVEPDTVLGETARWWLGAVLGLEFSADKK